MNERLDVLDANLARLLTEAYAPVVPTDVFRRRVELAVARRVGAPSAGPAALPPRRWWLPVAAVASLLALVLASVWWLGGGAGGSPTARAILARGEVAVRSEWGGRWRALAAAEAARELRLVWRRYPAPALELAQGLGRERPGGVSVAARGRVEHREPALDVLRDVGVDDLLERADQVYVDRHALAPVERAVGPRERERAGVELLARPVERAGEPMGR